MSAKFGANFQRSQTGRGLIGCLWANPERRPGGLRRDAGLAGEAARPSFSFYLCSSAFIRGCFHFHEFIAQARSPCDP
jgi:hypothetical protein